MSLEGKRKIVNGKGGQKFPIFKKYLYDNENIMFRELPFMVIFITHLFPLIVILMLPVIYTALLVFIALPLFVTIFLKEKTYGLWSSFKWMQIHQESQNSRLSPVPMAALMVV